MSPFDIKDLIKRAQRRTRTARDELLAVAVQIESELNVDEYVASDEELEILDSAMATIDRGEVASKADVEAAFARFSRK